MRSTTVWRDLLGLKNAVVEDVEVGDDVPYDQAVTALDHWLAWAARSRLPSFARLARSIRDHRTKILNAIAHRLSNALIESVNTKIRLITRIAFGFKNVDALIALAMLSLGGHRPQLPGRPPTTTHG